MLFAKKNVEVFIHCTKKGKGFIGVSWPTKLQKIILG